jgi:hypothetical protein
MRQIVKLAKDVQAKHHRTNCWRILKQQLTKLAKLPTNLNLVNGRAISRSESGVGIIPKRQRVIF